MFRRSLLRFRDRLRNFRDYQLLPPAAKAEFTRDRAGIGDNDPGTERTVTEALRWLGRAQDRSRSSDGGVARHYNLMRGDWSSSYPETTGYIIPTLLDCPEYAQRVEFRERARRMLDWLVSIQLPKGGFQGGMIDQTPVAPVVFNTGQILIGLARGAREWDRFVAPMRRAARWLVETLDADGCWRRYQSPFAIPGEKAYDTHVAWGLFEADRLEPGEGWSEVGLRHVDWALSNQKDNGWFEKCDLSDPAEPLTHTIGYALRGVIEAHRIRADQKFLVAACRTADALLPRVARDGFLAGRFDRNWRPAVRSVCLTGSAQIAICFLMLHELTRNVDYRDAAYRLNAFVRRTIRTEGHVGVRGGIKGSFPIYGDYAPYEFINWAAKFVIDANLLEARTRAAP